MENDLISSNQSGYKPECLSFKLFLSTAHEIYKSFDCVYDIRCVFLDNSKAFDKIRLNGVVLKLKQNGVSGNLRIILLDYLDERKEKEVLNGQVFSWTNVAAGVRLVHSLVQYSFSPALLEPTSSLFKEEIRFPKIRKKGGGEIFYKNGGLEKKGEFSRLGGCLIFLLSWVQSWYSYALTIGLTWVDKKFSLIMFLFFSFLLV